MCEVKTVGETNAQSMGEQHTVFGSYEKTKHPRSKRDGQGRQRVEGEDTSRVKAMKTPSEYQELY